MLVSFAVPFLVTASWLSPCVFAGRTENNTVTNSWTKLVLDGTGYDEFVYIGEENEMQNFRTPYIRYRISQKKLLSIVTWIKPELGAKESRQYIIEGYFDNNFQLFIENGTLGYTIFNNGTYTCPGITLSYSKWTMVTVRRQTTYSIEIDIHTKPLDTTTLPSKATCSPANNNRTVTNRTVTNRTVTNRTVLLNDFQRILLGRGFKGEIAHTEIGLARHYQLGSDWEWIHCLRDQVPSECVEYWSDRLEYKTEVPTNTSVRRELENEIKLVFNTRYSCKDEKITMDIKPGGLGLVSPTSNRVMYSASGYYYATEDYKTEYHSNLTLGPLKKQCNFTWNRNEQQFEFSGELSKCGFWSEDEGNLTIHSNRIFYYTREESRMLMGLTCRSALRPVLRKEVNLDAFVIEDPNRLSLVADHTLTPWNMSLALYGDSVFSERLNNPVKVKLLGPYNDVTVYVEAMVDSADIDGVEIVIESCRTRVTLNAADTLESVLISDAKPVKAGVKLIYSKYPNKKRFRFQAARFQEFPDALVYLSCVLSAT